MEKHYSSSIKISTGFGMGSRQPLDARSICATVDDMNSIPETRLYEGFVCYCEDIKKYFRYDGKSFIELSVEHVINNLTSTSVDIGLSANMGRHLKELLDKLEASLEAFKTEVGNNNDSYDSKIEEIHNNINSINESLTKSISNLESKHDSDISSLKSKDTELSNKISTLETKHDSDISSLEEKDTELDNQISELKSKHDSDISSLGEKDTELSNKISTLETKHDSDISSLKSKDTDQDSKISALEKTATSHTSDIDSLKAKDTDLESKITKNVGDISDLKDADESIKSEIQQLRDDVTTGEASSGKVKVDASDTTINYLENKIVSGTPNYENGTFAVTITKDNEQLKATVDIPIPVWQKL